MTFRILISVGKALWSDIRSGELGIRVRCGAFGVGIPLQVGLEVQEHHAI